VGVHEFFVTFITLFVAVDIVGVLPVYLGFVASLDVRTRQRAVSSAVQRTLPVKERHDIASQLPQDLEQLWRSTLA